MKISGGTTLGNCATGSPSSVTRPTMTMMIEITMATIGRLMKNLDMRLFLCGRCDRLNHLLRREICGRHSHALPNFLDALDHYALVRAKTLFDHPKIAAAVAD